MPAKEHNSSVAHSARRGARAAVLTTVASSILAAAKVLAGVLGNSYALIADGVESTIDVISSLVVWGSLRIAAQPPSERYPYGFGKAEPLAALAVAIALLSAAGGIAIQSAREIVMPHHLPRAFTLLVLVVVIVAKEAMFRWLRRTAESIGSSAIRTDAWHQRSDALTSLAAFVGISVALVMGKGYEAADDWAALFACAVIAINGLRLFRSALSEVLDVAAPQEVEQAIRALSESLDGVHAIEKCRVRKSGLGVFVDIHVVVDGGMTVLRGHEIAHRVKDALVASDLGVLDVVVHIEPAQERATGGDAA